MPQKNTKKLQVQENRVHKKVEGQSRVRVEVERHHPEEVDHEVKLYSPNGTARGPEGNRRVRCLTHPMQW
jgi:hypothetical protein